MPKIKKPAQQEQSIAEIDFLDSEEINTDLNQEAFLSEDASIRLKALFLK